MDWLPPSQKVSTPTYLSWGVPACPYLDTPQFPSCFPPPTFVNLSCPQSTGQWIVPSQPAIGLWSSEQVSIPSQDLSAATSNRTVTSDHPNLVVGAFESRLLFSLWMSPIFILNDQWVVPRQLAIGLWSSEQVSVPSQDLSAATSN
jgi:hypothetical protein